MRPVPPIILLVLVFGLVLAGGVVGGDGFCSVLDGSANGCGEESLYWKVNSPTLSPSHLQDLPGFTRSVYEKDHALVTPESHVFGPLPDWTNTLAAFLITPAMGSQFVMYFAKMQVKMMMIKSPKRHKPSLDNKEPADSGTLLMDSFAAADDGAEQDLLLVVPCNSSFPEAELLCLPTS